MRPALERLADRLPAAAIFALAAFPFLLPHHRHPLPTFYQEWWAVALGTLAVLAAAWRRPAGLPLPAASAPLLALAALILLQALAGTAVPTLALFAAGLLLWATALIALAAADAPAQPSPAGDRTGASPGQPPLAAALAWGLLAGGTLAAAAGLAQWLGAPPIEDLLSQQARARVWGNLNQPNHLATQLTLAIAAGAWLRARGVLPWAVLLVAAGLLVPCAVLTGSRGFWAYLIGLLALSGWLARRDTNGAAGLRNAFAAALLLALACKAAFVLWPGDSAHVAAQLGKGGQSDQVRSGLLATGAAIWREAPLAGAGWGRFPAASFPAAALPAATAFVAGSEDFVPTPGEHAHNLFVQLAAETGLAGLATVTWLLVLLGLALRRGPPDDRRLLGLALLTVLGLHSLVEYPLWYAYFLGVAALAVGLLLPGAATAGGHAEAAGPGGEAGRAPAATAAPASAARPAIGRRPLALLALAGFVALAVLRHDYGQVERYLRWPLADPGETPPAWEQVIAGMTRLRRDSAFAPWIDYALARALPIDGDELAAKLRMVELAMQRFPSTDLAFKRALLLARSGRLDEARATLAALDRSFPESAAERAALLSAAAAAQPELAALAADPG
jgi:O-antigen ligase